MVYNNSLRPPPLIRRHSDNPVANQQNTAANDEIHRHLQQSHNNENNDGMARSSTFNSPTITTMGNDEEDGKNGPIL